MKIYNFNNSDFNKCLLSIHKENKDRKNYILWICIYIGLFGIGVINNRWFVNGIAGMSAGRIVRYVINK